MIAFDFNYIKPATVAEANQTYTMVHDQGDHAMYFSGGTEIITRARVNELKVDTVIDIKEIAECTVMEVQDDKLVIGAAMSLNHITNSNLFPLLGETIKKIADHTSRNKITIGGNINSELIYKESVLPLLLVDAKVKLVKGTKEKIVPLSSVFDKKLKVQAGELLLQVIIDTEYTKLPYASLKKTRFSKVGYPVISAAAIVKDKKIRIAFSGVCEYPFRSQEVENILNDSKKSVSERIEKAINSLPTNVLDDLQGSNEYRVFVLRNMLYDIMEEMGMGE
ncbi:xanthine dehydrogenase [Sporosarcina sp. P13]|uniref:FAD binding domain-containing protein n=1 Tax=Sporosarcina sp. P13 TaxID=2048263 RepID=UPI000C16E04F|nr:FAD binding domain-containing protein [Sporosarcina sp. P13]PIC64860.1 xanthine dehydrogenase [Sporosarcina sp. P13]